MVKELYFNKSFCCIGHSLNNCLNCSYCRLHGSNSISYKTIPSEINPLFVNIPVAVNLFYGDPLLQIDNTVDFLQRLEKAGHKAPVIIITKGNFSMFPKQYFDLDLHFAFSTFGVNSKYDGGNLARFEHNLEQVSKTNYKYSIEYRPVIRDINDSPDTIENIYKIANKYGAAIGFCGLQVNDNLKSHLENEKIVFKPYDGYEFGLKKAVSKKVEDLFYGFGEEYNVPTFRKTSCLISYVHGMERDYNAHYYRPNEMRCSKCPMQEKCMSFKAKMPPERYNIPFKHQIIFKANHQCILHKKGICKFANSDCKNISGHLIKIDEKITSSDLRVIKWLTGRTVDCDFEEIEFLSKNWYQ